MLQACADESLVVIACSNKGTLDVMSASFWSEGETVETLVLEAGQSTERHALPGALTMLELDQHGLLCFMQACFNEHAPGWNHRPDPHLSQRTS